MDQLMDVHARLLAEHEEAHDLQSTGGRARAAADEAQEDHQRGQRERPHGEIRDRVNPSS
jgi:hypothetical protein